MSMHCVIHCWFGVTQRALKMLFQTSGGVAPLVLACSTAALGVLCLCFVLVRPVDMFLSLTATLLLLPRCPASTFSHPFSASTACAVFTDSFERGGSHSEQS